MSTQTRVNLGKSLPKLYEMVGNMSNEAHKAFINAGFQEDFYHLALYYASQINGCAFCMRLHAKDYEKHSGGKLDRLAVLSAWRETEYFSAQEKAALRLIEAVTLTRKHHLTEQEYTNDIASVLSSEQIAAIGWVGIVINSWNRIAITSTYKVAP